MMVIASMLSYAEIGRNDHQENAPHFINLKTMIYSKILKSLTPAPKASLINLGYRLLMSNMLKLKRKRPITTSQNHSDDQNTQL